MLQRRFASEIRTMKEAGHNVFLDQAINHSERYGMTRFFSFVDTAMRVRYAYEFTQSQLLQLRGTVKLPHGRRKAPYPRARLLRMVQPARPESATRRLRACSRLHDRSALRLGALGEHPAGPRPTL